MVKRNTTGHWIPTLLCFQVAAVQSSLTNFMKHKSADELANLDGEMCVEFKKDINDGDGRRHNWELDFDFAMLPGGSRPQPDDEFLEKCTSVAELVNLDVEMRFEFKMNTAMAKGNKTGIWNLSLRRSWLGAVHKPTTHFLKHPVC